MTLVVHIGTGIGVLALADFISDTICMWLLPNSPYYRNKKYMNVDEQEKEKKRQLWRAYLTQDELNKAYF